MEGVLGSKSFRETLKTMNLIPAPRKVAVRKGLFGFSGETGIHFPRDGGKALAHSLRQLSEDIEKASGIRCRLNPKKSSALTSKVLIGKSPGHKVQGYVLEIKTGAIRLEASDVCGLINGIQTLRQIVSSCGNPIPCMVIRDWPDFPVRGFYHDVTRGKVPTLGTLMALADKMASYKLNQLHLYVEHTFAFKNHPDIWEGADPLTAGEIRALADHCERLNIDLVPSLSTFGHFYTALRSRRKEHLNELNISASELPYSLSDRMNHYTLDCTNPESLALVTELIEEFLPLFKSRYFNICCDETFDLGKGKNAQRAKASGEGKLYVNFLKQIMKVIIRHGKIPMFWGDILIRHPDLLKELPAKVVALNWDYAPMPRRPCSLFQKAGIRYYACPGVHGWNDFTNHIPHASQNIITFAKQGKKFGAEGLLNTDWGDLGHVNFLAGSYHGMILGAAASWNLKAAEDLDAFDAALDQREFGDSSGQTCALLREAASAASINWRLISWWFDPSADIESGEKDPKTGFKLEALKKDSRTYLSSYRKLMELHRRLVKVSRDASPADALAYRELICGIRGSTLIQAVILLLQTAAGYSTIKHGLSLHQTADSIRVFERDFSELWHLRNKPSEYWRLKTIFIGMARRLDALA